MWKDHTKYNENYKIIIDLMKRALVDNSNDILALTNIGAAYCDLGKYDEALVVLKKAENLGSEDKNTLFNIGVALMNSKSQVEAKHYFIKSNKLKANELTYEAYIDFMGYQT